MTPEGIKDEGEHELEGYSPGSSAKECLEVAAAHGSKLARYSGGPTSIIQAQQDDAGVWHSYAGTVEEPVK